MQYILSEDEMENLVTKEKLEKAEKALDWIVEKFKKENCGWDYCDGCPLAHDVFEPDIESKDIPTREISKTICRKNRRYPK